MKKLLSLALIVILTISLTACKSSEEELAALYYSSDNVVNTDIGEYIIGQTAPLFTEGKLCYVTEAEQFVDENLNCKAAIVINVTDNEFVQGQDIFKQVYPASITKLMTAYIVMEYGNLDDEYTIKEDNCGITESGAQLIGFKKGDVVKVRDLLFCLLMYSGNDAGTALAEYISGDETSFSVFMNEELKKLGCNSTNFTNGHGLHNDNHYTSAYDVYIVLSKCMEYDIFKEICQTMDYEFSHLNAQGEYTNVSFSTTNRFKLGLYPVPEGITILGGKTGNTYAAGSCLVQYISDANGKEYIVGIFGAENTDSLYTQMTYLMNSISFADENTAQTGEDEGVEGGESTTE